MEIKKSNTDILEEAYTTLRNRLAAVANSCNVSKEEAEDLIQESYIRLSDKDIISKEEAKGKFWTTVRHLAIDKFRRQKIVTALDNEVKCIDFYDGNYYDRERIIKQMKSLLSPLQFRIMIMLVVDELEYSEIAKILNMNEGAVRTGVSRARKLLKEKLER